MSTVLNYKPTAGQVAKAQIALNKLTSIHRYMIWMMPSSDDQREGLALVQDLQHDTDCMWKLDVEQASEQAEKWEQLNYFLRAFNQEEALSILGY